MTVRPAPLVSDFNTAGVPASTDLKRRPHAKGRVGSDGTSRGDFLGEVYFKHRAGRDPGLTVFADVMPTLNGAHVYYGPPLRYWF